MLKTLKAWHSKIVFKKEIQVYPGFFLKKSKKSFKKCETFLNVRYITTVIKIN